MKADSLFPPFNPVKTTEEIISFLKSEVEQSGLNKVIVALSGGIDSTTVTHLLVKVFDAKHIFVLLLPYKNLNPTGLSDSKTVVSSLEIPKENVEEIDISETANSVIRKDSSMDVIRKGNVMARVRMTYLFDRAKKHKALVIGTENKSEHLLSYYTRFGDEASDVEPIRGLYKSEVRLLASHLEIPHDLISKPPTAGLWEGQTDEGQFGFSYTEADMVLHLHFDKGFPAEKIVEEGVERSTVEKVLDWVKKNEFKHSLPKVIEKV